MNERRTVALAAVVLAVCLAIAAVGVVVGVYTTAVRINGPGISAAGFEVISGISGALIGAVGASLTRDLTGPRALVALILALALGAVALVVTGFVIYDAVASNGPAISTNTSKVLATILGGIIGILLGYLGINGNGSHPPTADDDATPPPE